MDWYEFIVWLTTVDCIWSALSPSSFSTTRCSCHLEVFNKHYDKAVYTMFVSFMNLVDLVYIFTVYLKLSFLVSFNKVTGRRHRYDLLWLAMTMRSFLSLLHYDAHTNWFFNLFNALNVRRNCVWLLPVITNMPLNIESHLVLFHNDGTTEAWLCGRAKYRENYLYLH